MKDPNLLDVRTELDMTQAEMAAQLGVEKNTWARWERGELTVAHPRILELALKWLRRGRRRSKRT